MAVVLETVVIENNNPNMLLSLLAIISALFIIGTLISIKIDLKRLKKLQHAKKLILERHEKIEAENERRKKIAARKEMGNNTF